MTNNLEQAQEFLDALDNKATEWTFQTFDDNADRKSDDLAKVFNGTLDEHWDTLSNYSRNGAGVFVTINETDGKGRKTENITRVRAVFVDTDGADIEPIRAADPHILVETSTGNFHAYWLVSDAPLGGFKPAQKAMSAAWGTDKSINDLPRVMRLPGFPHQKVSAQKGLTGEPFIVKIVDDISFLGPDSWTERKAFIDTLKPIDALPLSQRAAAQIQAPSSEICASDFNKYTPAEILAAYPAEGLQYDDWLAVGMALHHDGLAYGTWLDWSAQSSKHDAREMPRKWASFGNYSGKPLTLGTIAMRAGLSRSTQRPTSTARSFEELLEAAKALEPGQIDEMEAIVAETAPLNPMRRDMIFRAIKDATKITLATIRAQLSQETGSDDPDQLDLARATIQSIGAANLICTNATVWRWQDRGIWTEQDDRSIKQSVQLAIDDQMIDVSSTLVNGVTDVLKNEIFQPDHEFNLGHPETVNCLNGELELNEFVGWYLEPHHRENYRTTQIPVEYDPKADAPMFSSFLEQVFQDDPDKADKTKALLELMGYTLMSHARHEKFVMLIGPGANGKSVLLAILEGLAGVGSVAGVQPSNFNNRFQRAHLHQKLANIVTELKQGEAIADAELKAITSGEPSTVEHKFKDPFVMRPFATCWFGTNHMPHTRDFSEALFRRAVILQFNRTFAKHEQDPLLKDKLLAELPGILNLSLTAYANALAAGFTAPASSESAKQEWRLDADQVAQFVDDVCTRDAEARSKAADVFSAYQDWALDNGIKQTMSQKGLRDRLTRLGFGCHKDRTARYVTGLRVPNWL